jgi:copper chaperone NosL
VNIKTLHGRSLPFRLSCVAVFALLAACSQTVSTAVAIEPGKDTECTLDGMLLMDFPGPKAQIHHAEGKPDFYCDLLELFTALLAPEQKRGALTAFVQDMGKTGWDHPTGNWIDARSATYVVGSKKTGSMGPTFASFSGQADAEKFALAEGGKVLRFDQITLDMASMSGGVVDDTSMSR